jgi:hypothetical protein
VSNVEATTARRPKIVVPILMLRRYAVTAAVLIPTKWIAIAACTSGRTTPQPTDHETSRVSGEGWDLKS